MELFKRVFTEDLIKKIFAVFLLVLLFYSIESMITLVLLTFVFSFLFYKAVNFAYKGISKVLPIKRKATIILIYIIMFIGIVYLFYNYIPVVVRQLYYIRRQLMYFNLSNYRGMFDNRIMSLVKQTNINGYLSQSGGIILKWVVKIEHLSIDIFIAFALSLLFILEQDKIMSFGKKIENSKVSYVYNYYKYIGKKFLSSFGKIMEIQAVLSIVNAVLASIAFSFGGFDDVLGIGVMMFILGLIPTAGLLIALIPLLIIAFTIGGIKQIVFVLIVLGILHVLENYILKPKMMSMSVHLPVFFVFVILIFSEHFMGAWGLIIGIPLFVFMLDILDISKP
jgi:predicted PurR-regulated permease PerM